jgi:hypothetical protein
MEVRVSHIVPHERGLFTSVYIPTDHEVARFVVARVPTHTWRHQQDFPHDAAFATRSPRVMIRDMHWTDPQTKPLWYFLNHSATPNVRAILDHNDTVSFRTLHAVTPDTELCFQYGDVPDEWNAHSQRQLSEVSVDNILFHRRRRHM